MEYGVRGAGPVQWTKASAGALYSAFGEADPLRRTRACMNGQQRGGRGSQ